MSVTHQPTPTESPLILILISHPLKNKSQKIHSILAKPNQSIFISLLLILSLKKFVLYVAHTSLKSPFEKSSPKGWSEVSAETVGLIIQTHSLTLSLPLERRIHIGSRKCRKRRKRRKGKEAFSIVFRIWKGRRGRVSFYIYGRGFYEEEVQEEEG